MATAKTTTEKIVMLPLHELHPSPLHPVAMREDNAMLELIESVNTRGIINPVVVRPIENGGYELIDGRRRKRACELARKEVIPAIVRKMDDDQAIIDLVDACIQREEILPCERAAALKMKLEALKRQVMRSDLTSPNNSAKYRSDDAIGDQMGVSGDTVRNIISLTQLIPELQQMVNDKKIALTHAYQIAALNPTEQAMLVETIDSEQATPSLSQAQRMKQQSQTGTLTEDSMLEIMCEVKKPTCDNVTLKGEQLRKYFPRNYTPLQIENTIYRLLENWQKQRAKKAAAEKKSAE